MLSIHVREFGSVLSPTVWHRNDENRKQRYILGAVMYCRFCGKEINDKAVVCTGCGQPVENTEGKALAGDPWSLLVMAGLVAITLFVPPVGLVAGIFGLRDEAKKVQGA